MNSLNRKFWVEFLELYKSLPVLWKVKSVDYNNRILKSSAYEKLINKLKEVEPKANREIVVRKINTFRSNYKKELKKVWQSKKSGVAAEYVYRPSIWYFNLLSFLEDQEDCFDEPTTIDEDNESSNLTEDELCKPPPIKKKRIDKEEDEIIKMACRTLQESNNDANIMAKGWAAQYAELSNRQKILVRKIISDVLFHGCLEQLNENIVRDIQTVLSGVERTITPLWSESSFPLSPQTNALYTPTSNSPGLGIQYANIQDFLNSFPDIE